MRNKLEYTFRRHLKESLKDPEFKKAWENSQTEYQLACQLIEKRLAKKLSQRALARKIKTSPAVISRLETMTANPSLDLLKRIASGLDLKLSINFK
ncbi:transcriptional regulator [Candidatus Shapirobacteria bacterium CG03_land_8_20_14_0_80_40_19]|uniref:Transcriptional regulator n=3 Tax=Candidatus Shapironibacteriota TaxID=1752721 RepID=A0A2M7BBK6_9BACT|nr:MAG: transcriptional regulator [Candidatus Shapirobacteria bacterium CG11_big_fil_rev_8_21_14_0_20_40_12]PIV00492.1 MAG: transcriptional regulator [Candidatus Shapirobacteria bacterium CG03_land_8_20_14_0_80_40_19]PJC28891.1 MAG: transcriptional regulator [Candidatus Shapirobacteria bacterium CG_4_9_14_0_2_um_filter_40_11]